MWSGHLYKYANLYFRFVFSPHTLCCFIRYDDALSASVIICHILCTLVLTADQVSRGRVIWEKQTSKLTTLDCVRKATIVTLFGFNVIKHGQCSCDCGPHIIFSWKTKGKSETVKSVKIHTQNLSVHSWMLLKFQLIPLETEGTDLLLHVEKHDKIFLIKIKIGSADNQPGTINQSMMYRYLCEWLNYACRWNH